MFIMKYNGPFHALIWWFPPGVCWLANIATTYIIRDVCNFVLDLGGLDSETPLRFGIFGVRLQI